MRFAVAACSCGDSMRSSRLSTYQLGLLRHAATFTTSPSALAFNGTCVLYSSATDFFITSGAKSWATASAGNVR